MASRMHMRTPFRNTVPWFSIILIMTAACTTVPSLQVWQPWVRTYATTSEPPMGAKLLTEVQGITEPLLGSELLRANSIKGKVDYLLERRGYDIVNDNCDYRISVRYRTERADQFIITNNVKTTNINYVALLAGIESRSNSGLGVRVAKAVGLAALSSQTSTTTKFEGTISYLHTLGMEIYSKEDSLIWKAESLWGAVDPDIETNIITAIQIILSGLPYDTGSRASIDEVRDSLATNYYRIYCARKWFTCPALPYGISFSEIDKLNDPSGYPNAVGDPRAFAAYVDLIQTAEYALPIGEKWSDPLKRSLWSKVQLGGQYLLGAEREPINILIELTGKSDGYIIKSCRIAPEKEFHEFQSDMANWRRTLFDFYDVYKK